MGPCPRAAEGRRRSSIEAEHVGCGLRARSPRAEEAPARFLRAEGSRPPTAIMSPSSPSLEPTPTVPKPRLTGRGIAIAAGLWLLYALLRTVLVVQSTPVPPSRALRYELVGAGLLALYSIPAWWLIVRELDRSGWWWKLAAHAIYGPIYAWIVFETLAWIIGLLQEPGQGGPEVEQLRMWIIFGSLTVYVAQFAIYHTIRSIQRLRLQQEQASTLEALARESELTALKAQINPHFLFNTLNSISATIRQDPEEARAMIAQLARLLRYALESTEEDFVPLEEELSFARSYLALASKRFGDRLEVEFDVDPESRDTNLPPMVLQPLVENAIRHGIGGSETGGTVRICTTRQDDHTEIRIEDTGSGIQDEDWDRVMEKGIGLKNTHDRLRTLYGEENGLEIEPNEPSGVRVRFVIPTTTAPATEDGHVHRR